MNLDPNVGLGRINLPSEPPALPKSATTSSIDSQTSLGYTASSAISPSLRQTASQTTQVATKSLPQQTLTSSGPLPKVKTNAPNLRKILSRIGVSRRSIFHQSERIEESSPEPEILMQAEDKSGAPQFLARVTVGTEHHLVVGSTNDPEALRKAAGKREASTAKVQKFVKMHHTKFTASQLNQVEKALIEKQAAIGRRTCTTDQSSWKQPFLKLAMACKKLGQMVLNLRAGVGPKMDYQVAEDTVQTIQTLEKQFILDTGISLPSQTLLKSKQFVGTLLPSQDLYSADLSTADPSIIGSQGLQSNESKSVVTIHSSYGDKALKSEKKGRNFDRVIAGELPDGRKMVSLNDGSGVKDGSLKVAALCAEYTNDSLSKVDLFADARSSEECQAIAKELYERALDPKYNPLASHLDPDRDKGATTSIVLDARVVNGRGVIRGGAVGDTIAFVLSDKGCQDLFICDELKGPVKDVAKPGGQLVGREADASSGTIDGAVKGIYAECDPGSIVLAASDGLSDNLNHSDMSNVIHFLATSSAFDEIPQVPPQNQYLPESLPDFDLSAGELKFKEQPGKAVPGKPTAADLERTFPGQRSSGLPSTEVIAKRLQNYVAWISGGLEKTENRYNDLPKTALSLVTQFVPLEKFGISESKLKEVLSGKAKEMFNKAPEDLSSDQFQRIVSKLDGSDPHYNACKSILDFTKQLGHRSSMASAAATMSKLGVDINAPGIKEPLYLLQHKLDMVQGKTGKFDDFTSTLLKV